MQNSFGETLLSAYDPTGRLTTLVVKNSTGSDVSTIVSSYDPSGRKVGELDNGVLATYVYDNNSKLTGQQRSGEYATFSYDSVGDTLVMWYQGDPPLTMSYNAAKQLTTSTYAAAVTSFTYDRAGNMTAESQAGVVTGFYYDGENRLKKILQSDGALSTYTYQGYNNLRRTNQEAGLPVYTTIWDNLGNYLGEYQ